MPTIPRRRSRAGLSGDDVKESDLTSTLGVVAGLLATKSNASPHRRRRDRDRRRGDNRHGAGQYVSDDQRSVRRANVMALATLIGSILPALPFFFGDSLACVLASVAITILAAGVIGHYRGYLVTYGS